MYEDEEGKIDFKKKHGAPNQKYKEDGPQKNDN